MPGIYVIKIALARFVNDFDSTYAVVVWWSMYVYTFFFSVYLFLIFVVCFSFIDIFVYCIFCWRPSHINLLNDKSSEWFISSTRAAIHNQTYIHIYTHSISNKSINGNDIFIPSIFFLSSLDLFLFHLNDIKALQLVENGTFHIQKLIRN